MLKRCFDIFFSLLGIIILSPLLIVIALTVALTSRGGAFYRQERVGKNGKIFRLLKFRTMRPLADREGQITIGGRDSRITGTGYFLRRYKLDELPQLFNVLSGSMSLVGPRPEVPRYVAMYSEEQKKVLEVRPGITDYASLEYFHENELLGRSRNPEETYVNEVMPAKLALNLRYINEAGLMTDLKIIARTLARIFGA
jgi:lipopolysaccharide/colanic/teichoic acid biosynthesis glycosyltransferase